MWGLLVCLVLVAAVSLQSYAYHHEWTTLSSPHPMLYFSISDVPALQQKARNTLAKPIVQRIVGAAEKMKSDPNTFLPPRDHQKFTSFWNEKFGNDLCTLAMYCVLFPDDREALELAHTFMERLATQPSWEVATMSTDELPITHSLVGLVTAYDFLYLTLTVNQRQVYFQRIRKTTLRLFERFKEEWWGEMHMQNHVWNNNIALLIGSLVINVHDSRAYEWIGHVVDHLNVSVNLANLIVDGSNNEGLYYATCTAQSMAMFIYLVDRHYGIELHNTYWLEQFFWFVYRTTINYRENVGIADSTKIWQYGPESILVFIDNFFLHTGYGNWLAARIRENNPNQQLWSMYVTEFIWYDPELGERNPDPSGEPVLTLFSDWGVVTYGGGLPPHNTFFSFKSGYLHGRAINAVVNERVAYQKYIAGWQSFNAGHEHPDQNSFTFFPRGQPFITETYYGPKYTFLNNVLMFAPSPKAKCFPPYEGQVGECYKWLDYRLPDLFETWAEIIAAYNIRGYVFTSGEAVGWYGKHLALESVYRSMLLLTPDILLVVDHIQLKPGSKVERANAFFNMFHGELSLNDSLAHPKAILKHNNQEFHAAWKAVNETITTANIDWYDFASNVRGKTQLLNISVQLQKQQPTRIAYVFYHGASPKLSLPQFIQTSDIGFKLAISIDEKNYELSVATHHSIPAHRLNWLGHTGLATLSISTGEVVTFGCQSTSQEPSLPTVLVTSMQWAGSELVAGALNKSSDFVVSGLETLQQLHQDTDSMPTFDPCVWRAENQNGRALPKWLYELYDTTYTSLHHLQSRVPSEFALKPNARAVVLASGGQMDSLLGLFPQQKSTKIVHILRDPRSWVAYVMKYGKYSEVLEQIVNGLKHAKCPEAKLFPSHQKLQEVLNKGEQDPIKILSLFWSAHATSVLQSGLSEEHLLLVWLEDLISEPEKTAERVFQFLGMPLPPASRHHLLQYTRSKVFELDSGEIVDYQKMNWWEDVLSIQDRQTVENTTHEYTHPLI